MNPQDTQPDQSRSVQYRNLLEMLEKKDLLQYGSVFPAQIVQDFLGITYPEVGSKRQFDEIALKELAAVDYVRNTLLGRGMYLALNGSAYRILLPSENRAQVERYMSSADKKLRRAQKLSRNTPVEPGAQRNDDARLFMRLSSPRRSSVSHQPAAN